MANAVIDRIVDEIAVGKKIPKPRGNTTFEGVGATRSGERSVRYKINGTSVKSVTESQLDSAFAQLHASGELTRPWFNDAFPVAARQTCHFTTIGGLFVLLGVAERSQPGVYTLTR